MKKIVQGMWIMLFFYFSSAFADLSVTDTHQVSAMSSADGTAIEYAFTVDVTNTGGEGANDVVVDVASSSADIVMLDGQVVAGTVEANTAVTSTDTFSFQIDQSLVDANEPFDLTSYGFQFNVSASEPDPDLPPDPATVAPSLDATKVTRLKEATEFLYTGSDPVQTGVVPETIDERRAAVVRGQVLNRDDTPLSGVTVRIKDHPELGQTLSRADGFFDLAVNGGGVLTLDYQKEGYLPVQRQVDVPWGDFAQPDTVVMIPVDTQVTTVNLDDTSQPFQVAQSSLQTDADGSRQATVFFPQGVSATLTFPGGGTQAINTLNVRATEYTVGENGPETMPGALPPTSGYTYAVELSVDEALAAGAARVDFSQPLPVYVDNFLDFPAGLVVPAGWYDREKAAWIASDNGRVIKILSISGGLADLDLDGSGTAADAAALSASGITDAERRQLALTFAAGKSLWRIPISHFTPWDYNWPYGPPEDAEPPEQPEPETDEPEPEPDCQGGSIIECQGAVLRERIPIVGIPFSLNYRSDQVPGRKAHADVWLSGDNIPPSLEYIALEVSIAGREFKYSFPAQTNLSYRFVWDGQDAYGRQLVGRHTASIRIGYVYGAVYYQPSAFAGAFARAGSSPVTRGGGGSGGDTGGGGTVSAREPITVWQTTQKYLQAVSPANDEFGGWTLSAHHRYHNLTSTLKLGDGTFAHQQSLGHPIETVAGNGGFSFSGDGGVATNASLGILSAVVLGPDGSLYIAGSGTHRIRRVSPEGIITTIAGTGSSAFYGDGGLATSAALSMPTDLAFGPDGSLYIADRGNHRIRRVSPGGIISNHPQSGWYDESPWKGL